MNEDKIRTLLERYWKGETEIDEEAQLKEFFSADPELPGDLQKEKELFQYFNRQSTVPGLNEDLTQKLRATWDSDELPAVKKIWSWRQSLKYAAILMPLIFFTYYLFMDRAPKPAVAVAEQTDSFDDPKKAIAETEKALLLLSRNMNDGLAKVQGLQMLRDVEKLKGIK